MHSKAVYANKMHCGREIAKLLPAFVSLPVSRSRPKIAILSVNWFATSSHFPVLSSARCRGVFPPHELRSTSVSLPLSGDTVNVTRKSSNRFAA